MRYFHIATKELIYNGRLYRKGQPWLETDGGDSPPVGVDWVIQRPQAALLTPGELKRLKADPYADLDALPAPAAPPPPVPDLPASEQKQEATASFHSQLTQEEIDDPYGLKARAAARTVELQAELDEQDSPAAS